MKDAITTIHERKSVRNYVDKPVSKDDLDVLLRAAMAAPSAADFRPWSFVVVTSKEGRKALSDVMPYGKMLPSAGAAIVVCGLLGKAHPKVPDFWVQDCSAAAENILLAAEAKGLGAVWLGVFPNMDLVGSVRKVLGIPKDVIPLNIISIGHPKGVEKPKNKFDAKNIHWEKW